MATGTLSQEQKKILDEEMQRIDASYRNYQRALGRYKGWGLVFGDDANKIIRNNYDASRVYCGSKRYQLTRWSSLSYDSDDYDEFGLKKQGTRFMYY